MIAVQCLTSEQIARAAELEAECFSDGVSKAALRSFVTAEANHYYGAVCDGQLCGYGGFSLAADEVEIITVAVAPAMRRRGVARALMERMLHDAADLGGATVYLDVRVSNTAAISLYRSLDFTETGVRKNYYSRPREDALLMRYILRQE